MGLRPEHEQVAIDRLRAAGLTYTECAALTRAGVWCALGIMTLSDDMLLAIRGVGPATLQRLRRLFPKS